MSETTLEEALALLDLAETVGWFQRASATVRFYEDSDGPRVRVACHTDHRDPGVITSSVQPVVDDSAVSLAQALTDAGVDIVAQAQRATLSIVR